MKDSDLISKKSSSDSENLVKNKVPERYRRKQTLKNAERYDINELSEIDFKLNEIDTEIEKLEQQIFSDLCGELDFQPQDLLQLEFHICDWRAFRTWAVFRSSGCFPGPGLGGKEYGIKALDRWPLVWQG